MFLPVSPPGGIFLCQKLDDGGINPLAPMAGPQDALGWDRAGGDELSDLGTGASENRGNLIGRQPAIRPPISGAGPAARGCIRPGLPLRCEAIHQGLD